MADREVFHYSIPQVQKTGTGAVEDGSTIDSNKLVIDRDLLLVSRLNPRKATICLASTNNYLTVCSTEFVPISPAGINLSFVQYITLSDSYRQRLESLVESATRSHQRVAPSDIYKFWWVVPSNEIQCQIVSYLDRETAKIDSLIDKQEQLIATLREDRAATITHVVTKGLGSSGGIASSGHQGPPAHWTRDVPLKRLAEVQTGLTLGRSVPPESAVTLPYLRVANVQVGRVDLTEVTEVEIDRFEAPRYCLRAGDVLMTEGGDIDKLGRGCLWQGEIDPCLHQNHVFAVRCSDKLDGRFLVYLLDTATAREYFTLTAKKTTNLASTNSTTLGRFSFPLPPIAEQEAIVDFLDGRCSKIDSLIDKSTEMIEALREFRSALITNAVTGKIDVREAV